jgi:hypothetical protein
MGDVVARHIEAEYRNRNPVSDESNRPGAGTRKRNAQAEGNQMSDTPISDSTPHNVADLGMRCRWLERQFNAANDRIKRLEEAGDLMVQHFYTDEPRSEMWEKAKEAKL